MFQVLLPVLAPVFIAAFVGVVWARFKLPFDSDMVSRLALYVGTPCLVLSSFSHSKIAFDDLARMGLACFVQASITALICALLIRIWRADIRIYLPAMVFPNVGNMGLPLALFAFGQQGLVLALAFFMVISLAHFSLGQSFVSGNWGWQAFIRNPILVAILAAIGLSYGGIALPVWLVNTTDLLGGFTIPLMLITLGFSLASLKIHRLGLALRFAVLRVAVGLIAGLIAVQLLGLDGLASKVVILLSSMPVAVFNYLFSIRYGRSPEDIAGLVIVSTLLSLIVLPVLLLWLLPV